MCFDHFLERLYPNKNLDKMFILRPILRQKLSVLYAYGAKESFITSHVQQLFIHLSINSWWAKYIEKIEKLENSNFKLAVCRNMLN